MSLTKDGFYKQIAGVKGDNTYLLLAGGGHQKLGNASGNVPISNGTLNVDLNADKLDGVHLNGIFTDFSGGTISSSGNTLTQANHTLTIGGVTKSAGSSTANIINSLSVSKLTSDKTTNLTVGITINGKASADKTLTDLIARQLSQTSISSLSTFTNADNLIYAAVGGGNSITDKPTSVDAFGVFSFKTASGWYGQLLISSNSATGIYWRTATSLSGGWKKLLDSSNYTDYVYSKSDSDDRYVNVIGDTMTGTLVFNYIADNALIRNTYGSTVYNLIRNHNNGNISISASSKGLYIGYENTTEQHFYTSGTDRMIIDSSGNVYPATTNKYNLGSSSYRWKALYIGTADSYGSATKPIYWNAGVPTACTYELKATVNDGAANRMAYYSGANAISQASSIYASTTALSINKTSAPANSGNFQVVGTSTMRHIYPESNNTYNLGSTSLRWANVFGVLGNYSGQVTVSVATGTAPFAITSTTKVNNLNVDLLDGYHAGNSSGQIPISNGTRNVNLNADLLDGYHASMWFKTAQADPQGKSNKPYHLVAEFNQNNASSQINTGISLFVRKFYGATSKESGILVIRCRYESNAATPAFIHASWSLNNSLPIADFILTYKRASNVVTLKLYAKLTGSNTYCFRKIDEGGWGINEDTWSLYNATNSTSYAMAAIPSNETQVASELINISNPSVSASNVYVNQNTSSNNWFPLVWSNQNNTTSALGNQLHKSYDYLLYNPSTKELRVDGGVFIRPNRDATLKIYSGKVTDGYSDGFIKLQTSIDGTDGQSHSYPGSYQARCAIFLQPRGGEVYIGKDITAASTSANASYKLNVGGQSYFGNEKSTAAYKNVITIFHDAYSSQTSNNSTAYGGQGSWGISFDRGWSDSYNSTNSAGIYAYGTGSWGTGLVFRVKGSTSYNTGHDRTALDLLANGKVKGAYGFIGNLEGNASTATKLQTARTINGVSFDGTANITIAPSLLISGNTIASKVGNQTSAYITVPFATNATNATNIYVNQHTGNNIDYPLVWSNQNNTTSALGNQLHKSYDHLVYNPANKTIKTTLFHSNASASAHNYTHIPTSAEIALETGNGNGGISAWIWRENYASSNWGIFHNNSTDYLHIVGNSTSRISVNLAGGNIGIGTDSPESKLDVRGTITIYPNANLSSNTTYTYPGGGYYATGAPNIRLFGDNNYGLSTIEFVSQKGSTSINKPSDCAFIQFSPYGVSAQSGVGSQPTLNSSGEINRLIIGVNNDSNDQLWLQTPGVDGLRHIVGTANYRILTSYNTYVSSGKGYINGTEITQVNNADTLDGLHGNQYVPRQYNTRFYPFVKADDSRSIWHKVTLPWAGFTSSSNAWMMTSMELVLGGAYSNNNIGRIYLQYYFSKNTSNVWAAGQVQGLAIGLRISDNGVTIKYDIANPGIFYVKVNNNYYNSFAIENISANDTAPSFDFRNTKIEAIAESSIPSAANQTVPLYHTITTHNGYWANLAIQTSPSTSTYPQFGSLSVINDSQNNGTDGLVYFRHYSNNDWGLIVDKSQSYSYGVDIRAGGAYALKVGNGNTRLLGATIIGADATPSYTLDVRGTIRATSRIYANEWIEFSQAYTGLYWPNGNNASHFHPNDATTYGNFVLRGSRGGYSGITMGRSANYMTIMDNGTDKGLYNETNGRWIIYYNRSNNRVSLYDSSVDLGYGVQINNRTGIKINSYPSLHLYRTDAGETSQYFSNNTAGWAIGINPWGVGAGVFAIGQYSGTGSSTWRFKIDNNGYCYTNSYLNLGAGNEKNASNPPYVLGFNGSDTYIRSYQTGYLNVNYANYSGWSNWSHYLAPHYDGGDRSNPQQYFNEGIGVKVAMARYTSLGGTSMWADTLWINGYTGGDVPNMCALTFARNASPRFFISTQSNRATSYGTYYEVWTQYNTAKPNTGTANRMAWYSATNAISSAANVWTNGSYLSVNYTASGGYPLYVAGDSYTTGWSRAGTGFYIENTGVHYTRNNSSTAQGELDLTSGNEYMVATSNGAMHINYRAVSRGTVVNRWYWRAGSSSSWAKHDIGTLRIHAIEGSYSEGIRIYPTGSWATIILGGNDLTADTGTSANSWSIHNNNGNFYLNKNTSNGAVATRLWGHRNGFTIGSTGRNSANLTVTNWLEVTGATSATMSYSTTNPRITFSESGSQAVGIVYTDYDSYRASKGLKVMDVDNSDTGNVWLEVQGYTYSTGFVKNGSSDTYVLLGGGGHQDKRRWTFTYNSANYNGSSGLTLNQMAADGNSNSHVAMIYAGTDNPVSSSGNWVHVWSQTWSMGVTSSWVSQIALGVQQGTGMWYRTTSGNIVGRGWTRVYDTNWHPLYWANLSVQTAANNDTQPRFGYVGIGTAPNSSYARLKFPINERAICFRDGGSYNTFIQYMTTGNEALVFTTQQTYTSFIFKCGHNLANGSDWRSGVIGTPSVQIKGQSLYVNNEIANGTTPTYNFYVNGSSYHNGVIYTNDYAGSWVSGMGANPRIWFNGGNNLPDTGSYHAFWAMKSSGGNVVNYGGLSARQGFYGYYAGRTANSYDWHFTVDTATGIWTTSKAFYSDGVSYAYGFYHRSYGSSAYVLTSDGGVKQWGNASGYISVNNGTLCTNLNADLLDGWHQSNIVWSGYVTSGTARLSSYWFKAWTGTIKTYQYNDLDFTLLVSSAYNSKRGIIHIRIRQNGANNSGAYNFTKELCLVNGNIPLADVRLYCNNSNGVCELWMNVVGQYGVYNYTVIKKTWRTAVDMTSFGTLTAASFSTAQSVPALSAQCIQLSLSPLKGYYWANLELQTAINNDTQPRFGYVGIGAAVNTSYRLYVNGASYINGNAIVNNTLQIGSGVLSNISSSSTAFNALKIKPVRFTTANVNLSSFTTAVPGVICCNYTGGNITLTLPTGSATLEGSIVFVHVTQHTNNNFYYKVNNQNFLDAYGNISSQGSANGGWSRLSCFFICVYDAYRRAYMWRFYQCTDAS